ncbi:MAG: hypothetical protein ACLTE4_04825 [Christensenellaceae bacterium]|jgi:hypothetical protein
MQKVKLPKDALAARIVFVIGLMIIVGMMVTFIVVLIFPQPASQETCGCMSPSAQIFFFLLIFGPFVTLFACLFFLIAWAILYAPDLMTEPEGAKILKRRRKVYLSFTIIFALLAIGTILLFALWPIR